MNLLSIILYSTTGEQRTVCLRPGELNIITGWSRTGKSALLDIIEFCLGRDTLTMPFGPITDTVAWYAVIVQLPTTRAFVARPAPRSGRSSTQQAMLEFGTNIEPLDFAALRVNTDSDAVREQVGRLIGIGENLHVPSTDTFRAPVAAHLGHALWLCLQGQGEIANRTQLFHRQAERGIDDAIRDTLPYFLGAVPADQALKRQRLNEARRSLRRLRSELATAEQMNADIAVDLRALLAEAFTRGLVEHTDLDETSTIVAALTTALQAQAPALQADLDPDPRVARRRAMERQRDRLRGELREIAEQRTLLNEQAQDEHDYVSAARTGASRLTSLELIRPEPSRHDAQCPMCGSTLDEPDASISDLNGALSELRTQLSSVETAAPKRVAALARLDERADEIRQSLRSLEGTLAALRAADNSVDPARLLAEQQAFTKGRIDLYLDKIRRVGDDSAIKRLRDQVRRTERQVAELEAELNPDEEKDQITSRLLVIAADMTHWADRLQLEHRGANVRIDLNRLTVVTDTASGSARLERIGSAENWVGYHLVTHLAMHRFFTLQNRPVPRMLILDQPTQAYYPSEVLDGDGTLPDDGDRAAVHRMFELMRDVAAELAPALQIIVCDHANLADRWFQNSIRHNWREGRALIPTSWISASG